MIRYLTEAEAGKKWCPRQLMSETGADECIASHCMAWRWGPRDQFDYTQGAVVPDINGPHVPPPGDGWVEHGEPTLASGQGWYQTWRRRPLDNRGFCGLAGHP